jgi:hypothetical protein
MLLAGLTFVTPTGALLALACLVPIAASLAMSRRNARGRALLRLPSPSAGQRATVLAVAAVPLLLGAAAAGPAIRTHVGRKVRTDAQAFFVFDTSRSMGASSSFGADTRFMQAQTAALKLRAAISEVPTGVASFTTQLIPHLFPTADVAAFNSTVEDAIGVEKPPPPFFQFGISGTSFACLSQLRNQGYFDPKIVHRYAIVLTDGESGAFDPTALKQALLEPPPRGGFAGRLAPSNEPHVSLLVIRVGSNLDHVYDGPRTVEAAYRPDPRAEANVETLASTTSGKPYDVAHLDAATAALRRLVGQGHIAREGTKTKTKTLAPYLVLLAFVPLGLIISRRNLTAV